MSKLNSEYTTLKAVANATNTSLDRVAVHLSTVVGIRLPPRMAISRLWAWAEKNCLISYPHWPEITKIAEHLSPMSPDQLEKIIVEVRAWIRGGK